MIQELPIPSFFDPKKMDQLFMVDYMARTADAAEWVRTHDIQPAVMDSFRICVLGIDMQITFCFPTGQLFVGGRSGTGAVDDNVRFCEWFYKNLRYITAFDPTMDTHRALQIFHPPFWVDANGQHPAPMTIITADDVRKGIWGVNPKIAPFVFGGDFMKAQRHALHYVEELEKGGKYPLIIWPFHGMLGGIEHALVPSVQELAFFHTMTRWAQTGYELKGGNLWTENYSVLSPEVLTTAPDPADATHQPIPIDQKNARLIGHLINFDAVIILGQAKSHCLAWSVQNFLDEIYPQDPDLCKKVYLLEDCTSPVVVPGIADFTAEGVAAFDRFRAAGMNVVNTTMPLSDWPGIKI